MVSYIWFSCMLSKVSRNSTVISTARKFYQRAWMCSNHFKNCLDFSQILPTHAPRGFRVHGFVYPVFMHAPSGFAKLNCGIYRLGSFIKGHACAPRFLKTAYIFHKNFPCMLPEVFVFTVSYIRLSCMLPEVSRNSTVVHTAWKFCQRA